METWQALGRLGPEALEGIGRPDAVPRPPTPDELLAARVADARRREAIDRAAALDRKFQATKRHQAALAASRRELAARQAAYAGAQRMNTVNRAARG